MMTKMMFIIKLNPEGLKIKIKAHSAFMSRPNALPVEKICLFECPLQSDIVTTGFGFV